MQTWGIKRSSPPRGTAWTFRSGNVAKFGQFLFDLTSLWVLQSRIPVCGSPPPRLRQPSVLACVTLACARATKKGPCFKTSLYPPPQSRRTCRPQSCNTCWGNKVPEHRRQVRFPKCVFENLSGGAFWMKSASYLCLVHVFHPDKMRKKLLTSQSSSVARAKHFSAGGTWSQTV